MRAVWRFCWSRRAVAVLMGTHSPLCTVQCKTQQDEHMHGTMSEESDAHAKLTEFDFSLIKRGKQSKKFFFDKGWVFLAFRLMSES